MGKKATPKRKAAAKVEEDPGYVLRARFSDTSQVFELDLFDLTGEEEIMLEEMFDQPLARLWADGWITSSAKGRVFLSFLARRRKEPNFTYEQAVSFDPKSVRREEADEEKRPTDAPNETGSPS